MGRWVQDFFLCLPDERLDGDVWDTITSGEAYTLLLAPRIRPLTHFFWGFTHQCDGVVRDG